MRQQNSSEQSSELPNLRERFSSRRKGGLFDPERASKRRKERAEIVKHRKWIFISLATIAVCVTILYCCTSLPGLIMKMFI